MRAGFPFACPGFLTRSRQPPRSRALPGCRKVAESHLPASPDAQGRWDFHSAGGAWGSTAENLTMPEKGRSSRGIDATSCGDNCLRTSSPSRLTRDRLALSLSLSPLTTASLFAPSSLHLADRQRSVTTNMAEMGIADVKRLEQELGVDIYPGTEVMTDTCTSMNAIRSL